MRLTPVLVLAPILAACKKVEPATKELDALLHWSSPSTTSEMHRPRRPSEPRRRHEGTLEDHWRQHHDLGDDEGGPAPAGERAAGAAGIFMVNPIQCPLGEMADGDRPRPDRALWHLRRVRSLPDADVEAFYGDADRATWFDTFTVTILGPHRRPPTARGAGVDLGAEDSPFGRALDPPGMPAAAEFESGDNTYDQDTGRRSLLPQPGSPSMSRDVAGDHGGGFDQDEGTRASCSTA